MTREAELELEIARLREALKQSILEYMFNVEVEGKANAVFDTADEAVRYAMHYVYLNAVHFQSAVDTLNQGHMYQYAYGFSAVHIVPVAKRRLSTPPSTTALQELIDKVERRTIERCATSVYDSTDYMHDERDFVIKEIICEAFRALPTGNLKLEDLK